MSVSAVIFDLFETLVTERDPDRVSVANMPERLGVEEALFRDIWRSIGPRRNNGEIPDFGSALAEVARLTGQAFDEVVIEALCEERLQDKAKPFSTIRDDIVRMLTTLRNLHLKLGVVSNASVKEVASWSSCALAPLVDDVVFSFQVGMVKPDVRIYHLACDKLGVASSDTVFIGDGAFDELCGAEAAGLRPYWATWFLDAWPDWKRQGRVSGARYPRLTSPGDVLLAVAGDAS